MVVTAIMVMRSINERLGFQEVRMYPRPGGFRPLSDEEPLNKANNEPNGDNEEVHGDVISIF